MSQISPPIRIVIVLAVAVMGAYMFFLRPKDEVVPAAAAPVATGAVSQPGKVGEAAQDAVNAANGQLAQQESVDGVDAGEAAATAAGTTNAAPGSAAAATNAASDLKGLPKPIARAIRKDKFLVLLFWNGRSVDDLAVRDALRKADRWKGRVHVKVASIKSIASYGRITRGVDVEQSPTIVIADPQLRAETLVGYVDTTTINQAVVDSMRNSTGLFTDSYLRKVNTVCTRYDNAVYAVATPDTPAQVGPYLETVGSRWGRFASSFKSVKAPRRWAGFKRATVADVNAWTATLAAWTAYVGSKPTTARLASSLKTYRPRMTKIAKRFTARMDGQRVVGCGVKYS